MSPAKSRRKKETEGPSAPPELSLETHVTTFYSFKGGVGRSLLLANVGALLSRRNRHSSRRVLLWDLDIEAPGLHRIPSLVPRQPSPRGFLDWLYDWRQAKKKGPPSARDLEALRALIRPCGELEQLDILAAFGSENPFAALYAAIDWSSFFVDQPQVGAELFRTVLASLSSGPYDHILIDSRTGLTDLGGLLTAQMPDSTVLVGGLGEQSAAGLLEVFEALRPLEESLGERRRDLLNRWLVVSPVPHGFDSLETERTEAWRKSFRLEPSERLTKIPHLASLLFREELVALSDPESPLSKAYLEVAENLEADRSRRLQKAEEAETASDLHRWPAEREAFDPAQRLKKGRTFEEKVARLLRLLDYEVSPEQLVGPNRVDLIARKRGGLREECFLVECKDQEKPVTNQQVAVLQQWVEHPEAKAMHAAGMFVAHDFSPQARSQARSSGLLVLTPADLEQRLFDFGPYLSKLCQAYEGSKLARTYVEQRALHEATGPKGGETLLEDGVAWAEGRGRRLWLVLGDYGTGKSVYFRTLAYRLAQRHIEDSSRPAPLAIDLKRYPTAISLESLLQDHLRQELNWHGDPGILLHLLEAGRLVLLLDGFDEMGTANEARSVEDQFRQLVRPAGTTPVALGGNRILLTCRTHFFREQQEVKDTSGGSIDGLLNADLRLGTVARGFDATLSELQLFDEGQIRSFLELHLPDKRRVDEAETFIQSTFDLTSLAPRPVLLEMIVESLPALAKRHGAVTPASLYTEYLTLWLRDRSGGHLRTSPEQRWQLLEYMAFDLWGREHHRIHYKKLAEIVGNLPHELNRGLDPVIIDRELRTAAFLVRTGDGYYSFSHKSFREYFFACHLMRRLMEDRFAEALDTDPITVECMLFFRNLLGEAVNPKGLRDALATIFRAYRKRVSENALRVAYRLAADFSKKPAAIREGMRFLLPLGAHLEGAELRGETLDYAWLSGAALDRADMQQSSLVGAELRRTSLRATDLRGARIDEADFGMANLEGACLSEIRAKRIKCKKATLARADLTTSRFVDSAFDSADLSSARVDHARFVRSTLVGTIWDEVDKKRATFIGGAHDPMPSQGAILEVRIGHWGPAVACAFSPDGVLLASVSWDNTLRFWEVWTGRELYCQLHDSPIDSCAFSRDGSLLATASWRNALQLWEVASRRELGQFVGHTSRVKSCVFSSDGELLASASEDGTLRLWEVSSGLELGLFEGHESPVNSCSFSPDDALLVSASEDGILRLWEVSSRRELGQLLGHAGPVNSCVFSPDGAFLASASQDHTLRLWEVSSGRELRRFDGHLGPVYSCTFSPDGALLASASDDNSLLLWEVSSGREIRRLIGHENWVNSCAFSPDGSLLASASGDFTLRLWEVLSGQEIRSLNRHENWVGACAFSPDSAYLAIASRDTLRFLDALTGREIRRLEGHEGRINSCAYSPGGALLASASNDNTLRLWGANDGSEIWRLSGHSSEVHSCSFSPDGAVLASASRDSTLRLWEVSNGREIRVLGGHEGPVRSCAFAPDGSLLASASDDGTLRLWDVSSGCEARAFSGHEGPVRSCAFSPDGSLLASASDDGTLRLWEVTSGRELRRLEAHGGSVESCAFSPDGVILASTSVDKTLRLWKVSSGRQVRCIEEQEDSFSSCMFSPNGALLASSGLALVLRRASDGNSLHKAFFFDPGWLTLYADGFVDGDEAGLEHCVYVEPEERYAIPTIRYASDLSSEQRRALAKPWDEPS